MHSRVPRLQAYRLQANGLQDDVYRAPRDLISQADVSTRLMPSTRLQVCHSDAPVRIGLQHFGCRQQTATHANIQACCQGGVHAQDRALQPLAAGSNQLVLADAVTQTTCEAQVQVGFCLQRTCTVAVHRCAE
jgi:hypothetical protein